jgi:hypothetical protein
MASIKRSTSNPDKYYVIENGKKVLGGRGFLKDDAKRIAAARTRLKKKKMATKKKTTARKSTGIASYTRKIQNSPAVKSADKKVKDLERKLKAAKKAKAVKVKAARKKLK